MLKSQELVVASLGQCQYASPLNERSTGSTDTSYFVSDSDRIRLDVVLRPGPIDAEPLSLETAGPRQRMFFRPDETTAAIVTCGGLSPGLNNVIRSMFYELTENYGVSRVLAIRNSYLELNPESRLEPIALTKEIVEPIDKLGGTVLLCDQMARNAVHAAMAGKTGVMIGSVADHIVDVPIPAVVGQSKLMEVSGDLWRAVLHSTAQPRW